MKNKTLKPFYIGKKIDDFAWIYTTLKGGPTIAREAIRSSYQNAAEVYAGLEIYVKDPEAYYKLKDKL